MKKLTRIAVFAALPLIAVGLPTVAKASAGASCSDGLTQQTWDGTPAGYCRIFFPNCTADALGKRLSYSRETTPDEVICVGEKGAYTGFYQVTLKEANGLFNTSFDKMGVNYGGDLSKWLYDNCTGFCGGTTAAATADKPAAKSDAAPSTDDTVTTSAPTGESTAE
ncbi:MAG: hypothetical protein FWC51_03025 [Proteobacteria bacterium]|nr:hypothetical protein [Pseudomonadota bacterium]